MSCPSWAPCHWKFIWGFWGQVLCCLQGKLRWCQALKGEYILLHLHGTRQPEIRKSGIQKPSGFLKHYWYMAVSWFPWWRMGGVLSIMEDRFSLPLPSAVFFLPYSSVVPTQPTSPHYTVTWALLSHQDQYESSRCSHPPLIPPLNAMLVTWN